MLDRERRSERWKEGRKRQRKKARRSQGEGRIIGGDEGLEPTFLGGCFCCCWQRKHGPHVETINRQTLPDSIIHIGWAMFLRLTLTNTD